MGKRLIVDDNELNGVFCEVARRRHHAHNRLALVGGGELGQRVVGDLGCTGNRSQDADRLAPGSHVGTDEHLEDPLRLERGADVDAEDASVRVGATPDSHFGNPSGIDVIGEAPCTAQQAVILLAG